MNTLEAARADLENADRKAVEIKQRRKDLDQEDAENESERKDLKEIIKLLAPKKKSSSNRKKSKAKPVQPSVHKPDAEAACLAVVEANPMIPKEELKELALHKLIEEQGFGRNGAAMQVDKCLLSPRFVIAADETVSLVIHQTEKQPLKMNRHLQLPVDNTAKRGFLS